MKVLVILDELCDLLLEQVAPPEQRLEHLLPLGAILNLVDDITQLLFVRVGEGSRVNRETEEFRTKDALVEILKVEGTR